MSSPSILASAAALVLFATSGPSAPQDPQQPPAPEVETKVRRMLELTGAADLGKGLMDQLLDQFSGMPGLPPGFVEKFKELAKPRDLEEMVVPIYVRHLEASTLDAVIAFAESAEGKKYFAAQPAIAKESMEAGSKWGRDLAGKVMQELKEK